MYQHLAPTLSSGDINVYGSATGQNIAIGHGARVIQVIQQVVEGMPALSTDYATRVEHFLREYLGADERPVSFGGRTDDISSLDSWIETDDSPHYLLLAAPAGRGKSALLVQWHAQLLERTDLAATFFPISVRFRTNLVGIVFPTLTAHLAALHGEQLTITPDTPLEVWREFLAAYLARPLPDGRRHPLLLEARQRIGFEMPQNDIFHVEPTPPQQPAHSGAQPPPSTAEDQVVHIFLQNVFTRKMVSIQYRSPYRDKATYQIIEPLGVLWDREYWYLVGRRADGARDTRFWRADRVIEIRPQMQIAQTEQCFDIQAYLGRNWLGAAMQRCAEEAPVKIRLTQQQAERLRQDWYYRQAVFEPLSETETLITFGADDPEAVLELLRWLGVGAELLEPRQWRGLMKDCLTQMLARYSEDVANGDNAETAL